MYGLGYDSVILDIVTELLATSEECPDLMYVLGSVHVPDRAQIGLFGFRAMFRDDVIVKNDASDPKFHFPSFDLYSCLGATAYQSLKQVIELLESVCPCRNVVAVHSKSVPQCLRVAISIQKTTAIRCQQTRSQISMFVVINVLVKSFKVCRLLNR